jgi:hypothetical protein
MQTWLASPYRAVGIYIGGVNRACSNVRLSADWAGAAVSTGWSLIPLYVGLQAPCVGGRGLAKISPTIASSQGTAAADDAAGDAAALGLSPGSPIYFDMEAYTRTTSASSATLSFLSSWTSQLHTLGYVSGVYSSSSSGIADLDRAIGGSYTLPDHVWTANWNGQQNTLDPYLPSTAWPSHQRIHQYRGGHDETYGGVTINIDNDNLDTPVATVAYRYTATGGNPVKARTGPWYSSPVTRTYAPGSAMPVICQAHGAAFGTSRVWDRLTDGTFVTDVRVSTPAKPGYSAPLPRCTYPYQVTAASGLTEHTGPGAGYPSAGTLPGGALGWVTCQHPGPAVGTSRVWDKLRDGHWASDYYLASPGRPGYTQAVPRC